jgi:hypothetical protein
MSATIIDTSTLYAMQEHEIGEHDRLEEEVARAYLTLMRASQEISETSATDIEAHLRMGAYCGAMRVALRSMLEKLDPSARKYALDVEAAYERMRRGS